MGLEEIAPIDIWPYAGNKGCMGFPGAGECGELAEYEFDTPLVVKTFVPDAVVTVRLCIGCLERFIEDVPLYVAIISVE